MVKSKTVPRMVMKRGSIIFQNILATASRELTNSVEFGFGSCDLFGLDWVALFAFAIQFSGSVVIS